MPKRVNQSLIMNLMIEKVSINTTYLISTFITSLWNLISPVRVELATNYGFFCSFLFIFFKWNCKKQKITTRCRIFWKCANTARCKKELLLLKNSFKSHKNYLFGMKFWESHLVFFQFLKYLSFNFFDILAY